MWWVTERIYLCVMPEDEETRKALGIEHEDEEVGCSVLTRQGLEYLYKRLTSPYTKELNIVLKVVEERRDVYTGERWRTIIAQFPDKAQIEFVLRLWLKHQRVIDALEYLSRP